MTELSPTARYVPQRQGCLCMSVARRSHCLTCACLSHFKIPYEQRKDTINIVSVDLTAFQKCNWKWQAKFLGTR